MCITPSVTWRPFLSLSFDKPYQVPSVDTLLTLCVFSQSVSGNSISKELSSLILLGLWHSHSLPSHLHVLFIQALSPLSEHPHPPYNFYSPPQALLSCAQLSCCLSMTSDTWHPSSIFRVCIPCPAWAPSPGSGTSWLFFFHQPQCGQLLCL